MSAPPTSGAFIDPPARPPLLLRLLTRLAERIAGERLLQALGVPSAGSPGP